MSPTVPQWSQQHWSSNYKAIFCWERSGHLKTIQEWCDECDKTLKASTWPPDSPDPWTFEQSGGISDSSATHQSTDLWGRPVLFGTTALVVNPLSPVGSEVKPPWNRLIPVRPTAQLLVRPGSGGCGNRVDASRSFTNSWVAADQFLQLCTGQMTRRLLQILLLFYVQVRRLLKI